MSDKLLSVVMVGRNDDYGGDFRKRLQLCMDSLVAQLHRFRIPSEVIFVNYNPLPEPAIEAFIRWPRSTGQVSVRVLTVPNEAHRQAVAQSGCSDVPVLEYFAKNAAIRRATGRFILSMNPDILLPDSFFAQAPWEEGAFVRADRLDYTRLEDGMPKGFTRLFLKGFSIPFSENRMRWLAPIRWCNGAVCRWRALTPRLRPLLDLLRIKVYPHNVEYRYHCNVSGDLLLMARERWHRLCGHSEQAPIALHVDALMVAQAAASGLREHIIADPILHLEHSRRYDAREERPDYREAYLRFQQQAQEMLAGVRPPVINNPDWGLSIFDLRFTDM